MEKILLPRPWRHSRGMLHPGVYRVPLDISAELAKQAIAYGGAVDLGKDEGGKRKGPAPENRMTAKAPENKVRPTDTADQPETGESQGSGPVKSASVSRQDQASATENSKPSEGPTKQDGAESSSSTAPGSDTRKPTSSMQPTRDGGGKPKGRQGSKR